MRSKVAVIGAGTMGHGIAQVAATAGYPTALCDSDPAQLERGLAQVSTNLEKGVALGKVLPQARDTTLTRLTGTPKLAEAVLSATVVIEAVPERLALKTALFGEIAALVPSSTILATNTSSLSIARIAAAVPNPGRVVGLHFFNPVHIMALVEVVHGQDTDASVVEQAVSFVRALGKQPIVVADSPGFASSRLGVLLGLEAIRMVESEVASPEDIDKAMVLGYRHPMGPLRLTDLVGLDVRLGIAAYLYESLGLEAFRPPEMLQKMVDEGKLGKKSGQGFYEW